jgi:hypothetical protein
MLIKQDQGLEQCEVMLGLLLGRELDEQGVPNAGSCYLRAKPFHRETGKMMVVRTISQAI